MDRPIPGFYYDKEKKRYFKIQPGNNAPAAAAAYNADNVRKRKLEEKKAEQARKRREKTKYHIKRAGVLGNPLAGGHLVREFGVVDPELPVESWTSGLREKGGIDFVAPGVTNPPTIQRMLINGDDRRSGMGVVYAATTNSSVGGCYIPTDGNDRINFNNDPQMRRSRLHEIHWEGIYIESMTSLNYHRPSHKVIMTVTDPRRFDDGTSGTGIILFSPKLSTTDGSHAGGSDGEDEEDGERQAEATDTDGDTAMDGYDNGPLPDDPSGRPPQDPRWLLGECEVYNSIRLNTPNLVVNSARIAPSSHTGSLALLATNRGIIHLNPVNDSERFYSWVGPTPSWSSHGGNTSNNNSSSNSKNKARRWAQPPLPRDVLSADFHPTDPNIVFAGCRDGKFFRIDRRTRVYRDNANHGGRCDSGTWECYHHRSSVAHIRALDDYQILTAGPHNSMAVYDIRWMVDYEKGGVKEGGESHPVIRMHEYQNKVHIHIGLDVAMGVGATGGGIVAAAQDDGTVGVFSLRSGRKLRAGDLDRLRVPEDTGVVKTVQFARMPWERDPSLFVGAGSVVKKFSFGVDEEEDDDY